MKISGQLYIVIINYSQLILLKFLSQRVLIQCNFAGIYLNYLLFISYCATLLVPFSQFIDIRLLQCKLAGRNYDLQIGEAKECLLCKKSSHSCLTTPLITKRSLRTCSCHGFFPCVFTQLFLLYNIMLSYIVYMTQQIYRYFQLVSDGTHEIQ